MATNKKNRFFNGLGYLGEKIGAGFMQSVEGIWDFSAGGLADLFGADEWAKKQMSTDWFGDWYNTAGDWFDAKGGWKTAGDVAGGIGSTLPAVVTALGGAAAAALTGGAAAPVAVKAIALSIAPLTAGLGAAGTSTKEAMQKTGKLTGKEYGYGALSGALEGGIEALTGALGTGTARIAKSAFKSATKTAAQEAAEAVAKKTVKSVAWKAAKRAGTDFVSEGFEEGLTELVSPYLQRLTYDPSAENATAEEIAYAALVGGLAGSIVGTAGGAVGAGASAIMDAKIGKDAIEAGQAEEILSVAAQISKQVESGEAGYEVLAAVDTVYKQLAGTVSAPADIATLPQKAQLGKLKKLLSVTRILPDVENSAKVILANPEAVVARYNELGITDENGNAITAEKLTEGIETDASGRATILSLRKALSNNRVLGTLAVADAMGKLMVDHNTYVENATTGGYLGGRAQYQSFVENASAEQKAAVARLIGVESLDAVDYETFAGRMTEYANTAEGSERIRSAREAKQAAESTPANEKTAPPAVSVALGDGVHRFGGEDGIAIIKNGDTVRIYDYATKNTTRPMTVQEATAALQKARRASSPEIRAEKVEATDKSSAEKVLQKTKTPPKKESGATESAGKRHAIKYPTYSETDIRENMEVLADMDPVATVDASKLEKSGKTPKEMFAEYFSSLGNSIYSEEFGDIALGNSSVKSEIRHGLTAEKIASMEAIPSVIEQGKVIFFESKMDGDDRVKRIVVAAPIKIGDASYYMGVMLQRDPATQYLYLHNVAIEKEMTAEARAHLVTTGADARSNHLSMTSILQKAVDVKLQKQKISSKQKSGSQNLSTDEIAAFAKENVPGYEDLLPAEQREIRAMIRQGKALGVPDADIKTYARVSARSGIRVAFSKERTVYTKEDGTKGYADGFYDPVTNEIVVNPEGTRSPGKLLMHELSHALYSYKKYRAVLDKATRRMDEVRAEQVTKRYREAGESAAVISEELAVHHAEDVLGSKANLERVVAAEPNIKSKILSFFRLAKTDYAGDSRLSLNAGRLYRHFEKAFNDFAARNRHNLAAETVTRTNPENTQVSVDGKRYAFKGRSDDGRGIYEANFPKGTPKEAKSARILEYIQNVWSKKPIKLVISNGETSRVIEAQFDPTVDETKNTYTDADKIAGGNRHGSRGERRVTLDLADDYYQIASEAEYHYSKEETGKDTLAHKDVKLWHYFVNDILFAEYGEETLTPYTVSINVKEKDDGSFVYSFSAERTKEFPTRQTIHAAVNTRKGANGELFIDSIPDSSEKINPSDENSSRRKALPDTTEAVGKSKKRYEPSKKEIFFTAKDRAYIETVDELYGIEKYLHKIGGTDKATVEADVQLARAARSQAQTMIGSVQYNVFSDKPERMGDGLLEIYKPTRLWSQEKYTAFDNYLLHQLNIDRMTLESRSKAWTAAERAQIAKVEGDIATLNTQMKTLRADIRKAETAINNAKVRRGTAKLAATKARWQTQVDALTKQKATDEADLKKAERDTKRKIAELRRLRKELKALELKNKPVFGKDETLDEQGNMKRDHDITADESRAIVAECEKKYPEFAEIAKKLYTYLDNLQTMRVEAGLISRESADYMKKLYPHYVPSYRDTEGRGISVVKGKNNLEISTTVKKAKGGNQDILDVASSIATQTDELMKAGRINQLAAKLYDAAKSSGDTSWVQILSEERADADADNRSEERKKISDVVQKALQANGVLGEKYNQVPISDFPADVAEMVARASDGLIDVSKKRIALEGGKLWHEYRNHNNTEKEQGKHQLPMSEGDLEDAVMAIYSPDVVECIFHTKENPAQAQSFAYAKKTSDGHYVVVEVVGGNRNPNVTPAMLLRFSEKKWDAMIASGMTLGEILYENDPEYKKYLDVAFNKKNRVTAAQFASSEAIANTPRSPRFTNSIPDSAEKINPSDEISFETAESLLRPKEGQLTFYRDGKKVTMEVSKEILLGFEALRSPTVDLTNPLERMMAKINSLFKRGVTSLNPAFMLRNPIRDLQDAGLNSRHPAGFAKMMAGIAQKGILVDDPDFQLYRALGGFSSTVFDGVLKKQSGYAGFDSLKAAFDTDAEGIRKVWDKMTGGGKAAIRTIENANAFLEQMTRFAEFKASLAAGDSPAVALNNSAEVTTNFGRRGRLTKKLNATLMPFLNPAIQGFDKIFRNVGDAFTGGHMVRGVASLLTKAALIGALPMVLNRLMYDDDEDYEKLRETDKENYFLVKIGDGNFIKIPRGRLASVIGGAYNRSARAVRGEDPEVLDYLDNAKSQITPVENVSRNIFSPLSDVRNNRTWYGGEIEGQQFDATAPRERYDESTSRIAVAIGSIIPNSWNFSPKKIHYLLDQYSGVVGDFVLPATTEKEHKDFFAGNFTLDSVTSNKLSEKFYDLYDKTQYADTAGDTAAAYRLKYLNRVKKSIRALNEELEAIRTGGYSNTEKLSRTRTVRALINAQYDAALKSISALDEAIEATADIGDEVLRDAEVTRRVFGAESALENYNKKSFERYTLFHKAGVGFDELYVFHFATLGLENDTDKKGNVIEGSKRKKIVSVINSLNVPREQKLMLLAAKGYTPRDGDIRGVSAASAKRILLSYIMKQKITKDEKAELARSCGFTVKNGVIVDNK